MIPGFYWVRTVNPPWNVGFVGPWVVAEWMQEKLWRFTDGTEPIAHGKHFRVGERLNPPSSVHIPTANQEQEITV